jgi:hypothetical protein
VSYKGWKIHARVGSIEKLLIISPHALDRISQRFGWDRKEVREIGKEVCKMYHRRYSGRKAEIPLANSVWVVKKVGNGTAIVKTVMPDHTTYAMEDLL